MEHGSEHGSKESWSDSVVGFFWLWVVVQFDHGLWVFFLFFLLWLVVIWSDCC